MGAIQEVPLPSEPLAPRPIYRKLLAIMQDVAYIKKDKRNEFHRYNYASEAAIKERMHEALVTHGVVFTANVNSVQERTGLGKEGKESLTTISVDYAFTDSESGDQHLGQFAGTGIDSADKGLYKAITGAIKYIMTTTFMIATGDDPEEAGAKEKKEAAKNVGEAKLAALKAGKSPSAASAEAHGQELPPDSDVPPSDLSGDINAFPSKETKGAKPYDKFAMFAALEGLKTRFVTIEKEPAYRAILQKYGATKRTELPTNDGGKAARSCYKELQLCVQDLEVEAVNAGKLPNPFLPDLQDFPSEIQPFCVVKGVTYRWTDDEQAGTSGYRPWKPTKGRKS